MGERRAKVGRSRSAFSLRGELSRVSQGNGLRDERLGLHARRDPDGCGGKKKTAHDGMSGPRPR